MNVRPELGDLARAEFEARLNLALRRAEEAEARSADVREGALLAVPAGQWGEFALWNLVTGSPDTARDALRRSVSWSVRWLESVAAAGLLLLASQRRHALEVAIMAGDLEAERRILRLHPSYGDLTVSGKGYVDALQAFLTGDEAGAAHAAELLESVPDEKVIGRKFYPRLGPTVRAILARNPAALRSELDAICAQHVVFSTRGFLRRAPGPVFPATCLLIVARQRGMDVDVDVRYHAVRLKLPVTVIEEWQGEPVRGLTVEGTFDIVPRALLPDVRS